VPAGDVLHGKLHVRANGGANAGTNGNACPNGGSDFNSGCNANSSSECDFDSAIHIAAWQHTHTEQDEDNVVPVHHQLAGKLLS
jgi:hypothetical protein